MNHTEDEQGIPINSPPSRSRAVGTEPSEWAMTTAANIAGTITEHTHKNTSGIALAFALALDAAQRAASVRVVREWKHTGGTVNVSGIPDGSVLAIIERPAEAATSGVKDGHVRLTDGREVDVSTSVPKTADGVLMFPGFPVFIVRRLAGWEDTNHYGSPPLAPDTQAIVEAKVAGIGCLGNPERQRAWYIEPYSSFTIIAKLSAVFSTREAAEAAAGEGGKS